MTLKTRPLAGRHAIVTGGATGIGLAISRHLVAAGAHVTIASRNLEAVLAAAAEVDGVSGSHLDVSDAENVNGFFDAAGPADILVNNAGIAISAPFAQVSLQDWASTLATNLTGTFLCTQAALPAMREKNSGRIVNIASTAGLKGYAYTAAYTASKHGVIGLTRSLAAELAQTGITVNCVCPGFTDTQMVAGATKKISELTGRNDAQALGELLKNNPQRKLITPEEVADAVLWLCQDSSRSINGQSIVVAGGEIT